MRTNAPEGTQVLELTFPKLQNLWEKLSKISGLFDDFHRNNPSLFLQLLTSKDTAWFERTDGNGILYLTSIIPRLSATAHIVYWDKRLRGKEEFTLNALKWVFQKFDLKKINLYLPEYASIAQHFAKKLGFQKEGQIRRWSLSKGKPFDIIVYGMIPEEVFDGKLHGPVDDGSKP